MLKKLLIIGCIVLCFHLVFLNTGTIFSNHAILSKTIAFGKDLLINMFKFGWNLLQSLFFMLLDVWQDFSGKNLPSHIVRYDQELYQLYQQVAEWSGLPWQIFWGIHAEETTLGKNLGSTRVMSVLPKQQKPYFHQICRDLHWDPQQVYGSHKGAIGPFQFIPETWVRNAVDANGDGRKDPFDIEDAAYSAANYLLRKGGQGNLRKALWHYNQDRQYIRRVMRYLRYR